MLQTMICTMGPALLVAAPFTVWWLITHRGPRVEQQPAAPARLDSEALARLQAEVQLAAVIEGFEQAVTATLDTGNSAELLSRLSELSPEAKRRLSAECAHAIGTVFAHVGRHGEALSWLGFAEDRSDAYFRDLNGIIGRQITGTNVAAPEQPRYPFHHIPWPDLAARSTLKAQLLHDLGRHAEVEALLFPFVQSPPLRYVRAELRRQRGELRGALADYRAVAAWNPEFKQVQYWLGEIAAMSAPPLKVEPLRPQKAAANHETTPPPVNRAPARPSQGTTPYEVLGLVEGAPTTQVQAAYLALSRQYHPDRVASLSEAVRATAEDEMREINSAWRQLSRRAAAG